MGFQAITTAAAASLSHLVAAGRRGLVQPVGENLFANLPDTYPRAWACLAALADTIGPGGRSAYRAPDRACTHPALTRRSGRRARCDQ